MGNGCIEGLDVEMVRSRAEKQSKATKSEGQKSSERTDHALACPDTPLTKEEVERARECVQ